MLINFDYQKTLHFKFIDLLKESEPHQCVVLFSNPSYSKNILRYDTEAEVKQLQDVSALSNFTGCKIASRDHV